MLGERSGAGPYNVTPAAGQNKPDSAYTETASACCGALWLLDVEFTLDSLKLEIWSLVSLKKEHSLLDVTAFTERLNSFSYNEFR